MCHTMVNKAELVEFHKSSTKLCRAIEVHPCVYDRNSSQYLKREAVDAAWKVIAKHCNDSVKSCKIRWRNIRSAYKRSLQGSTNSNRVSNRIRDYYLHNELKFYWPYALIGNSEQVDYTDDINDDEFNTSEHSRGGSGNNEVPRRIRERRKSSYDAMNKISEQSKSGVYSDDENDGNVGKMKKEQHQAKTTKEQTFYIKKIPKKAGTLILKKQKRSKTVDYPSEINDLNADKVASPKKCVRFKRACKRGIDKTIIRELSVRKRKANEKRMRLSCYEKPEKNQHILSKRESPLTKHNENENNSTVPVVCIDSAVQCEIEKPIKNIDSDRSIEDFLNMLRPRLEEMNMRKKMIFQMKVMECIISTLDDTTDLATKGREMQTVKNIPIESTIVQELRSIRELVTKQQNFVVQKPIAADAATSTTNANVSETIVANTLPLNTDNVSSTPDKIVNNNEKTQRISPIDTQNSIDSSVITTPASDVGIFIVPRAPNAVTSGSTVIMTTVDRLAKYPTTTPASNANIMRRYSFCGDSPPINIIREPHEQITTTSANAPSTISNSYTTGKPRRIMRTSTINQFDEPERHSPNTDAQTLVPRTVAANTKTTCTITRPTSAVSTNASTFRPSYIMSPKLLPHIQIAQQQPRAVPVTLTSVRTTTPSVASSGVESATVTASTSSRPSMAPKILLRSLLEDVNVEESVNNVNDETETAAIITSDKFSVFPIKTEPLD